MNHDELVARFLKRAVSLSRWARIEFRLFPEQKAAYDEAAMIAGDIETSAWARRVLDAAARKQIKGAR